MLERVQPRVPPLGVQRHQAVNSEAERAVRKRPMADRAAPFAAHHRQPSATRDVLAKRRIPARDISSAAQPGIAVQEAAKAARPGL